DLGQRLAVTLALVVAGLVLELVNPDLRTLGVGDHLGGHRDAGQLRRVGDEVVAVDQENRGQRQRVARRTGELLDLDHVALGDLVLLAAGLDDRVHRRGLLSSLMGLGLRWHRPGGAQQRGARKCAAGKSTPSAPRDPNPGRRKARAGYPQIARILSVAVSMSPLFRSPSLSRSPMPLIWLFTLSSPAA